MMTSSDHSSSPWSRSLSFLYPCQPFGFFCRFVCFSWALPGRPSCQLTSIWFIRSLSFLCLLRLGDNEDGIYRSYWSSHSFSFAHPLMDFPMSICRLCFFLPLLLYLAMLFLFYSSQPVGLRLACPLSYFLASKYTINDSPWGVDHPFSNVSTSSGNQMLRVALWGWSLVWYPIHIRCSDIAFCSSPPSIFAALQQIPLFLYLFLLRSFLICFPPIVFSLLILQIWWAEWSLRCHLQLKYC